MPRGRPPSKLVTEPVGRRGARDDHFTRAELVMLEQSWMHENPSAGKMAFYRWYAETYYGLRTDQIGESEIEQVRQLMRDAKRRAKKAGWLGA